MPPTSSDNLTFSLAADQIEVVGFDNRLDSRGARTSAKLRLFSGSSYSGIQKCCTELYITCLITGILAREPLKQLIRCQLYLELLSLLCKTKNTMDVLVDNAQLSNGYRKGVASNKLPFLPGRIQWTESCNFCIYHAFSQDLKDAF